jgi:predicted ATPase
MPELPTGTVTFLFTDIEGSTRLLEEAGERYAELLEQHRRVLREAFARHGGVEVDTQGDAFFVAFARGADAVAAAEEAQRALELPVRMGIHTGEPQLADGGYVGIDVHRAARICAAAHGRQVVLSEATQRLLEHDDIRDLGRHRLKDVGEVRLYQLGDGDFPPLRSLNQTNLPLAPEALLGRKKELADVLRLIRTDGARLVTITGPGGIGKTRFAIEVATELVEEFRDGVWFVDLSALRDPELVLPTISSRLGAKGELAEHISGNELLLVLDNLEQVVEAATQLAELLGRSSNLRVLVTSREPLHVRGDRTYALRPLAESPAVELFRTRAEVVDSAFEAPYEQLAEVCSRLDNLPLALELAAARTRALTVPQLLERLEERLPLLSARRRDLPERQRTLRATIGWSCDLLAPEEQELFRRLSVFAGGFTFEAAEEVCDADVETLESLVEKNLVRREGDRFTMLETIREFASELFAQTEERDRVRLAHARHYRDLVQETEPKLDAIDEESVVVMDRLEAEIDNVRSALVFARDGGEVELMADLLPTMFMVRSGSIAEAVEWLSRVAHDDELSAGNRAHAAYSAARSLGDSDEAYAFAQLALEQAREAGDARLVAVASHAMGDLLVERGSIAEGRVYLQSFLDYVRSEGIAQGTALALGALAEAARKERNEDEADALAAEALEVARRGQTLVLPSALERAADVAFERGDLDRAEELYRESLELSVERRRTAAIAADLAGLAAIAALRGQRARAGAYWGAAQNVERTYGGRHAHEPLPEVRADPVFEAAAAVARSSPLDEAIHAALSDVD